MTHLCPKKRPQSICMPSSSTIYSPPVWILHSFVIDKHTVDFSVSIIELMVYFNPANSQFISSCLSGTRCRTISLITHMVLRINQIIDSVAFYLLHEFIPSCRIDTSTLTSEVNVCGAKFPLNFYSPWTF